MALEYSNTPRNPTVRFVVAVVAALLVAGAALIFYEVLLAMLEARMDVTIDGWLFVAFLSLVVGVAMFAGFGLARISLGWRFVAGGIVALLFASGVLFLFGLLLALMS